MNSEITGKIIVVGNNIDTDQIYPGCYLALTDRPEGDRQPLPERRGREHRRQLPAGRHCGGRPQLRLRLVP